ncbi:hypothetical protein [Micromonospora aurantiaca (nom. illeg.)]|uniref:pPIWI_RE_Y domain-containing protein n=1 Tax=Micromonospora aurantiaca (nom. illeg.) TaxID=47850 RepID=UPI0001BF08FE|nr:hypothetical protein [Micromonospora aurantiaca]ADL49513.1 hypothetical protein Micau_6011 [Micromonospora aurantiaca ATCC 27029]
MIHADLHGRANLTILPQLARGLIDLGDAARRGSLDLPYPPSIQRVLDRIVLACLREGRTPPSSVPELIAWCTAPLGARWPSSALPGFLSAEVTLLDLRRRLPTRSCAELAAYGSGNSAEQSVVRKLDEFAQAASTPALFTQCRDFLIDRVAVTNDDTRGTSWKPQIWKLVQDLYRPPVSAYAHGGLTTCPTCGLLATVEHGRIAWCEGEICERGPTPGPDYKKGKVRVLDFPLRLFLSLPGRTERAVMRRLAERGVTGTLLPGELGAYQLSEPVLGRSNVQVFDRVEPLLLAAQLSGRSDLLAVIPDHLARARPALLKSVRDALPPELDVVVTTQTAASEGAPQHA